VTKKYYDALLLLLLLLLYDNREALRSAAGRAQTTCLLADDDRGLLSLRATIARRRLRVFRGSSIFFRSVRCGRVSKRRGRRITFRLPTDRNDCDKRRDSE